jgi:hypothetical protein
MSLPGVRTVLKNRFYNKQRTDTAVGPRVLAIGYRSTAEGTNGVASLDPVFVTDEQVVIESFGSGSDLHKAFLELSAAGAPRIYLVAIPATYTDSDLIANTDDVFDTAFDAAESVLPDIIVPYGRGANSRDWDDWATPATPGGQDQFGFYADNSSSEGTSMAVKVADKVAEITARSHPCHAVIGIKPFTAYELGDSSTGLTTGSMTVAQVATHLQFTNLFDHNDDDNDNGHFISVVAAEVQPIGFPADYGWSNGACAYAGALAQMDSWQAPTGRNVFNVQALRYNPNRVQLQDLIDQGLVSISLDFTRAPQWVDALTFAQASSDYTRVSTVRIVFDVMRMVRLASQPFIGQPASLENRNALETSITGGLRNFQQLGALLGSDFVVTYIPRENRAEVDLVLQPAFEIRNIDVNVSLQL